MVSFLRVHFELFSGSRVPHEGSLKYQPFGNKSVSRPSPQERERERARALRLEFVS